MAATITPAKKKAALESQARISGIYVITVIVVGKHDAMMPEQCIFLDDPRACVERFYDIIQQKKIHVFGGDLFLEVGPLMEGKTFDVVTEKVLVFVRKHKVS